MTSNLEDIDPMRLLAGLRELSKAFVDGRQGSYGMRIPAEPYRDGDLVCGAAGRLIERLTREVTEAEDDAREAHIRSQRMANEWLEMRAALTKIARHPDPGLDSINAKYMRSYAKDALSAAPAQPEGAAVEVDRLERAISSAIHELNVEEVDPDDCRESVLRILNEALIPAEHRRAVETSERRLTLDNAGQVFFYEQDHYYLSNFSAFMVMVNGLMFPTSEHAYHWDKFPDDPLKQRAIQVADSTHDAFKMAERWKPYRRPDWDDVKVGIMKGILTRKVAQHEYVRRKLLETGDRELIENSWRDDYWGWGPNRDGQNMLGKLWMEIRAELRRGAESHGA